MTHTITVRKADGTEEEFQSEKLRMSLKRAGATEPEVAEITARIESELASGVTTEALYHRAFELLRESEHVTAARYSLRRAMLGLGPTGFPFEDYLARLFAQMGYETKTRVELRGKCVAHEIDLLAFKDGACIIGEAKFHAMPGMKSDLQVVLYSHARFMDIQSVAQRKQHEYTSATSYVITNTKFTTTAIKYAKCAGMQLLSWDYPRKGNLQDLIQSSALYPLTVLQSISPKDKSNLMRHGVVLCREIIDNYDALGSAGIPKRKFEMVMEESRRICALG